MPNTLTEHLRAHAKIRPDKAFVEIIGGKHPEALTYGQLWRDSLQVASALQDYGVQPGAVVLIMLKHGADLHRLFMGAMLAGAIPSFMPYPTPKQEGTLFWNSHRALFDRIRPAALVVYDEIFDPVSGIAPAGTRVLTPDKLLGARRALGAPYPALAESVAFLQHSSGTTGHKKGVMLSHRAVLAQWQAYAPSIGLESDTVIASWLPLYHDMGLIACFMLPMIAGATVYQMDAVEWVSSPLDLLSVVEKSRAELVWLPNFAFNHIALSRLRQPDRVWDLSSLRAIINCSEPCKPDSMHKFTHTFADCGVRPETAQVCYAMAETVFAVTQTELGHLVKTLRASKSAYSQNRYQSPADDADCVILTACGRPLTNMGVRIVDDEGIELPEGAVGEVCITGQSRYDGYFNLEELTAERLRGGWHHTGDLGFMHGGELYIGGRKDDLIIVRGRNFYAHDIEAIVNDVDGVKPGRCIVFPFESAAIGTAEAVCLVERLTGVDPVALRRTIKTRVEALSGLVLGRVQIVEQGTLIKTTSGKISREANSKRFSEGNLREHTDA